MSDFPNPPREIDRADVLGELEFRWAQTAGASGGELPGADWVLDTLADLDILRFREPDDEVGICRREDHDGGYTIWQRFEDEHGIRYWGCAYSTAPGNRIPGPVSVNVLARLPYAGCAPGTPAAVRLLAEVEHTNEFPPEPEDLDLPMSVRQRIAELLVVGYRVRALRVLKQAVNIDVNDAWRYLESLSEYRTGLNHRPVETVELPEVDNEAVALGEEYAEKAQAKREVSS